VIAGVQKPVLAAVVLDEAGAVGRAVVLEDQPLGGVVEIRSTQEAALAIVDRDLGLPPR
jgi:hypothetical protein